MIISTFSSRARLLPHQSACSSYSRKQGAPAALLTTRAPGTKPACLSRTAGSRIPAPHKQSLRLPHCPHGRCARPRSPACLSVVPTASVVLNCGRLQHYMLSRRPHMALACSKPLHGGDTQPSEHRWASVELCSGDGSRRVRPALGCAAIARLSPARPLRGARCCSGAGPALAAPGLGG